MKKLLTVSLVAVMAVSAAHAKIASTDYVGNQIKDFKETTVDPLGAKVGSVNFANGAAAGKTDVTSAIDAVAGIVAGLSGEGEGSVTKALTEAKGYTDEKVKDLADGAVKTNTEDIAELAAAKEDKANKVTSVTAYEGLDEAAQALAYPSYTAMVDYVEDAQSDLVASVAGNTAEIEKIATLDPNGNLTGGATKAYTDAAIQDLVVEKVTAENGKYFNAYAEADGKIAMEQKAFETTIKANEMNAPTTGAVYDAIQGGIDGLDVAKVTAGDGKYFNAYAEANGKISMEEKAFETTIEANVNNAPTTGAVYTAVATAKSEAISEADTAAKALIQLTQAMTDCANKQCALTLNKGNITWEEVINQ